MSEKIQLPKRSDFPSGAEFVIKEFDVPLVWIPGGHGWFNWFGGEPRPYDPKSLRVDNNWRAKSFEEWVEVIVASMTPRSDNGEPSNSKPPQSTAWDLFEED